MKNTFLLGSAAMARLTLVCTAVVNLDRLVLAEGNGHTPNLIVLGTSAGTSVQTWVVMGVGVLALAGALSVAWYVYFHRANSLPPPVVVGSSRVMDEVSPSEATPLRMRLLTQRCTLTETAHSVRDQARDMSRSPQERLKHVQILARHSDLQSVASTTALPGAQPPPWDWHETLVVCRQSVNLGLVDDARELLGRPDVIALLPPRVSDKSAVQFAHQRRVDSGSRCLECAKAWCDIAVASNRDADVQEAGQWFQRAIDWLPPQQDVDVLLEWAEFLRHRARGDAGGRTASALLAEARARLSAPGPFTAEQKVAVWVSSAECEMDALGVPKLLGPAGAPLPILPENSRALISDYQKWAREVLRGTEPYYLVGAGTVTGKTVQAAPLHFRIQCAAARLALGSGGHAEDPVQCILFALGEHSAASLDALEFVPGAVGTDGRIVLRSGWSRLLSAGANLSAQDLDVAQRLRLRWVELHIDQADSAPPGDDENRQKNWRDAAWLLCRYWAWSDAARLTEDACDTERIVALSMRIVGTGLSHTTLGAIPCDWEPQDHNDKSVYRELKRRLAVTQPQSISGSQDTAGTVNLVCQAVIAPNTPGTVEELRLFDASGGAGTFSGHSVMVDVGGGGVVTRHGSFGYPLNDGHKVPVAVNPALVNLPNAIQAPLGVRGRFRELARFGLDGLSAFGPGFDVVLKDASGNERGRVRMDGLSAPGNGNPGPVDIRLLAQARLDLEEILAGLAVGAPPMNGSGSRLNDLADQFEGELGSALQQLCPPPVPGAYGPRNWLNREHMDVLWERASSRFDAHGNGAFDEPASKLAGLDAKVRDALRRFLFKYVRENPNAQALPALARLGIAPGGLVAPPPVAVNQGHQTQQPLPDSVEPERRFEELRRRAYLLGLERRTWLFESNRTALRDVMYSMIDRVQNERSASSDLTRSALLAGLEDDLVMYREQYCRPLA